MISNSIESVAMEVRCGWRCAWYVFVCGADVEADEGGLLDMRASARELRPC